MQHYKSNKEEVQNDTWYRLFVSSENVNRTYDTGMNFNPSSVVKSISEVSNHFGPQFTCKDAKLNSNCHANTSYQSHAPTNMSLSCMVIPDQKDRCKATKIREACHAKSLLQQIDEERMRKMREQSLEDTALEPSLLCGSECPDAVLTDIYGHVLVRRNKRISKKKGTNDTATRNGSGHIQPHDHLQLSSEHFLTSLNNNLTAQRNNLQHHYHAAQHPHPRQGHNDADSTEHQDTRPMDQGVPLTQHEGSFARGGHGIFGVPISDLEKQRRLQYQKELLEQIRIKREREEKERELQKIEDEKILRQIEEEKEKEKKREEEKAAQQMLKESSTNKQPTRTYQQDLLEQIQRKRDLGEEARKVSLAEDLQLLDMNEGRGLGGAGEEMNGIRRRKFTMDVKRKPRQSTEDYQQDLLEQIRERRAAEALDRREDVLQDGDLLRINEEKIARLILENQLIQPKLKHFGSQLQATKEVEVNKRYQEFLLQQMRHREAQLAEDRERELLREMREVEEEERRQEESQSPDYKSDTPIPERRSRCDLKPELGLRIVEENEAERMVERISEIVEQEGALNEEEARPRERSRRWKVRRRGVVADAQGDCRGYFEDDQELFNIFHKAKQERQLTYSGELLQQIEAKRREGDREKESERVEEEKIRRINRERERRRLLGERKSRRKEDKITNDQVCLQTDSAAELSPPVAMMRTSVKKASRMNNSNSKDDHDNDCSTKLEEKPSNASTLLNCQNAPGFWGIINKCRNHRLKAKKYLKMRGVKVCSSPTNTSEPPRPHKPQHHSNK